jgi:hypothetical protein
MMKDDEKILDGINVGFVLEQRYIATYRTVADYVAKWNKNIDDSAEEKKEEKKGGFMSSVSNLFFGNKDSSSTSSSSTKSQKQPKAIKSVKQ